ncbi:MAG: tetraacyldisaccharide 4'-kinase, partial [Gammaproteobacteria bacterium]|nr:tetraacyldisaccharide 4'-kinase [Gammaproteobacteria bacterium]
MINYIYSQWYCNFTWFRLLIPAAFLYKQLISIRKHLYARGIFKSSKFSCPVWIVGNITVGGSGKTPLVQWLVEYVSDQGLKPAVITRGYKKDALEEGDEVRMLRRHLSCPIGVGKNRVEVTQRLLSLHPEIDIIISDDGLQHYAIQRDIEIIAVDGYKLFGNQHYLPAGPLREGVSRINDTDLVVYKDNTTYNYHFRLQPKRFINIQNPNLYYTPEEFIQLSSGKTVNAIAGIAHPNSFFNALFNIGINSKNNPYPDHYTYTAEDFNKFASSSYVIMTEKDSVKCRGIV